MKYMLVLLTLLFSAFAHAELTAEQRATLLADIQADPVLSQLQPSSNAVQAVIAAYEAAPATACVVWKPVLTADVMRDAIVGGAVQLDNLTVGKRDALLYLVSADLVNTPALRTTLDDLCGSQNTLKASIQAAQKRNSNRLEKLFATGSCTVASPSTMSIEGGLSYGDVLQVMGW